MKEQIILRLAELGVAKPSTSLVNELEAEINAELFNYGEKLISKRITARRVVRAFARTLNAGVSGDETSDGNRLVSSPDQEANTIGTEGL